VWDDQEIEVSVDASISLEKLYVRRLQQLSEECQQALQVAACLGLEFDDRILEDAWDRPASRAIQQAVACEMLLAARGPGEGAPCRYRFENVHVHRAVLGIVPQERRVELHLDVGRRIWSHIDDDSPEEHLHAALSMFRIGRELIHESAEREAVASLCYRAGYAAARSSSFLAASEYFGFGLDILGAAGWREHYDLALSLSNAASEMNMCAGHFEAMDGHIDSILKNSRIFGDSVQARATRIYSYGMRDARQSDAVQDGVDVLRHLGVKLPRRGSRLRLAFELLRVHRLLKDKPDTVLLRLPTLRDSGKRSCLQILSLVYQNALFARPDLVPFVILRMIAITINHGMSEFASVAFANFGMLCIRVLKDVDMGFRYGSLGLALLDRFKSNELVPRVYATFYKHIYVHKKPIKGTLQPLAKAYRIGLYTGDLEAAFLCALYFCMNSFDAGIRLPIIEREYSDIVRRMESSRQKSMLTTALPLLRWKRDLMGLSSDPLAPDGDLVNYDVLKKSAEEDGRPLLVSVVLTCQTIVAHVLNEYDFAAPLLDGFVAKYLDVIPPGSSKVGATMTIGLCAVELARRGHKRRLHARVARSMARRLAASARQCPCNCLGKLYLLQAELASFRNDVPVANQLFLASIALSESSRSRYVWAKANEGMARHQLRLGGKDPEARQDANVYFLESCRVYKEWGAAVKVERLTREVRALFPGFDEKKTEPTRPAARPSLLQAPGDGSSSTAFRPRPRLSLIRADDTSSSQDLYGSSNF
jgi:hypothetical protein